MAATLQPQTSPPRRASSRARAPGQLRWLVDNFMQTQKLRIAVGNQIAAIRRGADGEGQPVPAACAQLHAQLERGEALLIDAMTEALDDHPAMPWLREVRGVGPTLAARLLGAIDDIGRFETVSRLWRFAGYAVVHEPCGACSGAGCADCGGRGTVGHREWGRAGQRRAYNTRLKTTVYMIGVSLLRRGSAYRTVYDGARERLAARWLTSGAEPWSPRHQHAAALRVMGKTFLRHLWCVWRAAEGLPLPSGVPGRGDGLAEARAFTGPVADHTAASTASMSR